MPMFALFPPPPQQFTYDATGNRLSKQTGLGVETYAYPLDSHRLASVSSQSRTYDATGNLTGDILVDRLALHELHRDEEPPVRRGARFIDARHPRMFEPCQRRRLALESPRIRFDQVSQIPNRKMFGLAREKRDDYLFLLG